MTFAFQLACFLVGFAIVTGVWYSVERWWYWRWRQRRYDMARVEQILERWAALERAKRAKNGRFRDKSIWHMPRQ